MTQMEKDVQEEARKWVEKMKASATPQERLQVASQLRGVAVRTRGAVPTRGCLSQAGTPLVSHQDLGNVLRELKEQPADVRREVSFALGEVGGEDMVQPLAELAKDPESSVRLITADAIGRIGGPEAVQALMAIIKNDPNEDVRALAVEALGILAIQEHKAAVRTRGAVRTGGLVSLSQALEKIGQEDRSSYVRDTVLDVLATLKYWGGVVGAGPGSKT